MFNKEGLKNKREGGSHNDSYAYCSDDLPALVAHAKRVLTGLNKICADHFESVRVKREIMFNLLQAYNILCYTEDLMFPNEQDVPLIDASPLSHKKRRMTC